jgi:hypothetical protein
MSAVEDNTTMFDMQVSIKIGTGASEYVSRDIGATVAIIPHEKYYHFIDSNDYSSSSMFVTGVC